MLLPREFVTYLSRQIVRRLSPGTIETQSPEKVVELVHNLIADELDAEDKLNDEVREKLEEYSDYMRREGISYQEMFRKAKNALVREKKIVKASGRDTGDAMKLSRDKITDISHKLIPVLRKSRDLRIKKDLNDARLDIVKAFTEILQVEEKADRASRDKVRTIKRDVPEGSEEWDILQKRYYSEELKKFAIRNGAADDRIAVVALGTPTVCVSTEDVPVANLVLPPYSAVMELDPDRLDPASNVAVPLTSAAMPICVVPLKNVTSPVGVAVILELSAETLAVNCTSAPGLAGLLLDSKSMETRASVVLTAETTAFPAAAMPTIPSRLFPRMSTACSVLEKLLPPDTDRQRLGRRAKGAVTVAEQNALVGDDVRVAVEIKIAACPWP